MIIRPPLPILVSAALAVGSGLLTGAGQAPMGIWPATLAGVALFTWLMVDRRPRSAFGLGYLAGLAMNTLTVSWISVLGVWVGVALVAFLSLWWGVLALAVSWLLRLPAWPLLVPAAWVAVEFASGAVPFGGFSWTRLGYTTVDQPMSGLLAWVGVTGVGYLVALVAQALLLLVASPPRRRVALTGIVVVFSLGGSAHLIPQSEPLDEVAVAMVQPAVNRDEKGTATYARSVTNNALSETIIALAEARTGGHEVDFVLWPENATDVDPKTDDTTRGLIELSVRLADAPVFVGAVTDGPVPDSRQTSSIWWHPESGPGAVYHKRDLVPFGEWIPFRDVLLPRFPILEQVGRQSIPGEGPGVVFGPTQRFPDLMVGTIICFELAYDDTSYDLVRHGAQVVVTQSNTNTYASTFQPHQQLVINRVRAMELGREIAVSTLNSLSAVVDARGRVQQVTAEYEADSVLTSLPLRTNINLSVLLSPWLAWVAVAATAGGIVVALVRAAPGAGSMAQTAHQERSVP